MLLDEMLAVGVEFPDYWQARAPLSPERVRQHFGTFDACINARNVGEYYWKEAPDWEDPLSQLPMLVPPFGRMRIETTGPLGVPLIPGIPTAIGAFIDRIRTESGWDLKSTVFVKSPEHELPLLAMGETERVDHNGSSTGKPDLMVQLRDGEDLDEPARQTIKMLGAMSVPLYLAISFMNCKNVELVDHPAPRLSKGRQKRGDRPLLSFKTLNISPMRRVLETEGNSAVNGLAKALHICRGHFKTFEPGKGLFGKHEGMFWWNNHVRGSTEQGVIVKDYAVKAPKS